jgi:UDP-2,3-diacylglucosamine pyrophosphatase LpxH
MKESPFIRELAKLFDESPEIQLAKTDKIVIFSDLHIGNRGRQDDFVRNSASFMHILEHYYLENDYTLVLNGDIEELQKFSLKKIITRWPELYRLFQQFEHKGALYKITGNHDLELQYLKNPLLKTAILKGLKLNYQGHRIAIFHGHQASLIMERFYLLWKILLRLFANPLGIKNISYSHDNDTRFKTERRVYNFSRDRQLVSIIGHTHRPLFESMSKVDCLKFKIEQLCRDYSNAGERTRKTLALKIKEYHRELESLLAKNNTENIPGSLYNSDLLVPCTFNSGCVIGKKGITAIEISNGNIRLVHWFNRNTSQKYFDFNGYQPKQLGESDLFRVVLKEDGLDYIFTRIELLSPSPASKSQNIPVASNKVTQLVSFKPKSSASKTVSTLKRASFKG